ncbi:hypothetical protein GCM10010495_58630 [Kitasatospora herbaricolor]|nr:hypothetical protein GCM10010495_58630 [Kitasatospora herbaricolor]
MFSRSRTARLVVVLGGDRTHDSLGGTHMAQQQPGNLLVWRTLVLVGAVGVAIGLIGKVPLLGLVAGPVAIVGVIGLSIARRNQ